MNKKLPWIRRDKTRLMTSDGEEILLKGVGLGGWLLPEGYMWGLDKPYDRPRRIEALIEESCGREYASCFWQQYRQRFITREDISYIASLGYNSVRLPINSRTLCTFDSDNQPLFIKEVIDTIDQLLSCCEEERIYCILDLHGAPGGQTGENIDDSEHDRPELFIDEFQQTRCVNLWRALARRYHDRSVIAGYDLLNEPLPQWHGQYNHLLLPLYRRITEAIREVDQNHMIILEGLHWATDFSLFEELEEGLFDQNLMLEFHKYWSDPDRESIERFLQYRERLQLPLFMGEGGENNLQWYTAAFNMFSSLDISWNFWTYKKMDCENSPVSFPKPAGWATESFTQEQFDQLLHSIRGEESYLDEVSQAILRVAPISIPAWWYDAYQSSLERLPGAEIRRKESISILFADGHTGKVDYCKQKGEPQSPEDELFVRLRAGESLSYIFSVRERGAYQLRLEALRTQGAVCSIRIDQRPDEHLSQELSVTCQLDEGEHSFSLSIRKGEIDLSGLMIESRLP